MPKSNNIPYIHLPSSEKRVVIFTHFMFGLENQNISLKLLKVLTTLIQPMQCETTLTREATAFQREGRYHICYHHML